MKIGMMFATLLFGLLLSTAVRAADKADLNGKWAGKDKAGVENAIDLNADGSAMLYEGGKPLPLQPGATVTWTADTTKTPWQLDVTVKNGDKVMVLKMIAEVADGKLKLEGGNDPATRPGAFTAEAITFSKK